MTLEEAIEKELWEMAKQYNTASSFHAVHEVHLKDVYKKEAEYHRQLAEWLAELKKLKEQRDPCKDVIIDEHYWKGFNSGIRTEKFRESKRQELIKAEIEQAVREETVVDHAGGEYERIISTIDPDDVLQIIDKYKKEQEDT